MRLPPSTLMACPVMPRHAQQRYLTLLIGPQGGLTSLMPHARLPPAPPGMCQENRTYWDSMLSSKHNLLLRRMNRSMAKGSRYLQFDREAFAMLLKRSLMLKDWKRRVPAKYTGKDEQTVS